MTTNVPSPLPVRLADALHKFETWRDNHKQGTRLPNHLWSLAVDLVQEHGISKTARTLRLDYYALKKRVEAGTPTKCVAEEPVLPFLELFPPNFSPSSQVIVEMENGRGAKMRIELKDAETPDLVGLSNSFWRG